MPNTRPIAVEVYNKIAKAYAARTDDAPFNAFYERPTMLKLIGSVAGKDVLEVGCGDGYYLQVFLDAGANRVVGVDASSEMLELARKRVSDRGELHVADPESLQEFAPRASFDIVACPLVLHYIESWGPVLATLSLLLRPGGALVFSVGHPMADFEHSSSGNYFETERIEEYWPSYDVVMPSFRRPLGAIFSALRSAGFVVEEVVEPLPVAELKSNNAKLYDRLSKAPHFLSVRAIRSPE